VDPNVILLVLIIGAFYLLVLAPARNRKQRAVDIKQNLKPGVEVITTSGMFGRVTRVGEDEMTLEVAPGVEVRYLIGALRKILVPKSDDTKGEAGPVENADQGLGDQPDGEPPAPKNI
jgi:preprotein translocase subunit YajC